MNTETRYVFVERSKTCCQGHAKKNEKIAHYSQDPIKCSPALDSSICSTEDINGLIQSTVCGYLKLMRKCECIECSERESAAFVMTKVVKAVGTSVLVSDCGSSFCRDRYAAHMFEGYWDSEIFLRRKEFFTNERIDSFLSYDGWKFIGNFSS
jgi:hypothetical protein